MNVVENNDSYTIFEIDFPCLDEDSSLCWVAGITFPEHECDYSAQIDACVWFSLHCLQDTVPFRVKQQSPVPAILGDLANNFFSIYGIFWRKFARQKSHVDAELIEMVQ